MPASYSKYCKYHYDLLFPWPGNGGWLEAPEGLINDADNHTEHNTVHYDDFDIIYLAASDR